MANPLMTPQPGPKPSAARTFRRYQIPDVTLVNQDGQSVSLETILSGGQPVALNFIFTTCRTICPVMSATFVSLAHRLGEQAQGVKLISISIDPDHDRPDVLKAYAHRIGDVPSWRLYTGTSAQIRKVLAAFDASVDDKTGHRPLTLLRGADQTDWIRIEGFSSADDLARELRALQSTR